MMKLRILFALAVCFLSLPGAAAFPVPSIPWNPERYACPRASGEIRIDGEMDEPAWRRASWTSDFVDIEGGDEPAPRYRTRAKMLWDNEYFYVAAEMEETDLWASYRARDSVIYHENDFEVFIDPDGDNHEYYELEINALGTEWDLFLVKPYRDGGPAIDGWDIAGLRSAVHLDGTINDASDRDRAWSVEIAFPWDALAEAAHRPCPPEPGDRWRVNFSRVEWKLNAGAEGYSKRLDPSGEVLPEDNWVWSPQGLVAMHYPEMWGFVEFVESEGDCELTSADLTRWRLCRLYYAERIFQEKHGRFTGRIEDLDISPRRPLRITAPAVILGASGFEILAHDTSGGEHHIDETGRLW